ncbi:RIPL2 protein, partial [Odontophorus gujanensis]|nr:RIPL2 protein [Odontophorus gujanensis]
MQRCGEDEEEDGEEEEDGGPESALLKSPFQLTAEDVYDISSVVGRDLLQLSTGPEVPAAAARLQFSMVRVLEMLEALVSESSVAEEQLRMERDSLRAELDALRGRGAAGSAVQPNLGPDKMVIDLTDPNRPRFTLQELRDVLQERNQLKAQLLVVQEELQCYKSGIISQRKDQTEELEKEPCGSSPVPSKDSHEKTVIKRL